MKTRNLMIVALTLLICGWWLTEQLQVSAALGWPQQTERRYYLPTSDSTIEPATTTATELAPRANLQALALQNDGQPARSAATNRAFAALAEKVKRDGSALVIVGLSGKFKEKTQLNSQPDIEAQRANIARRQEALLQSLPHYEERSVKRFKYVPFLALAVDAAGLEALRTSELIQSIEEDEPYRPSLAESTALMGAQTAWASGFSGAGQTIAILDTGVDKNHPFLAGKVVSEGCYSTTFQDATSLCPGGAAASTAADSALPCPTGCEHGTHVAGIAAGKGNNFSGVARDAKLIAMQVFSKIGNGIGAYPSDTVKALERVYELRSTHNIAAVNMSLGAGKYTSHCDAQQSSRKAVIDLLRGAGIATIIAAGNESYSNALGSPACISTAISVGSTRDGSNSNGAPGAPVDTVSSFSNSADFLHLLAPGQYILSSVPGGGFDNYPGTSMAAPHVAGAWAVLRSKAPQARIEQILSALTSTGKPVTDTRNNITKPRIQLDAALNALGGGNTGGDDEELKHDDGSDETGVRGDGLIVVNRFTPARYPSKLKTVRLFLAQYQNLPNPAGAPIRLMAFQGGTNDGQPPNGPVLLLDHNVTIPNLTAAGFVDFNLSDGPTINSGDWYIGFQASNPAGGVVFTLDKNGQQRQRSYFSTNNGQSYQGPLATGTPPELANAMIRAVVGSGDQQPGGGDTLALNSGTPQTGSLPAPQQAGAGVFGATQYMIAVPSGTTQLKIDLAGNQDVDLFARFGQRVELQNGRVVSDHAAATESNNESITITSASNPPLRAGTYYLALANFGPGAASFTLTATLASGGPKIEVQPAQLDFGTVNVGQTAERTLTVRNTGNAALNVSGVTSNNARFSVVAPGGGFTVAANAQQTVTVRFTPQDASTQTGTLTLASNDASKPSTTVLLGGKGASQGSGEETVALTSGTPKSDSLPAPTQSGYGVLGATQYAIQVPNGATQLKLDLNGNQDVDLFVRFGQRIIIQQDQAVADFQSTSAGGSETITASASSSPSLRGGTYYIAVANFGPGAAHFTVTATVTSGGGTNTNRTIRVAAASGAPGGSVAVPLELVSQGDESGLSFSLTFEPAVLSHPQAALGNAAPANSTFIANAQQATQGRLGIVLTLPAGQKFSAGTRQLAVVTFTIASGTSAATTNLSFGDQPVAREVSDSNGGSLPSNYTSGAVALTSGFEADLTPRPNGNGAVTATDLVLLGRFVAGLEQLGPGSEFQRADCAPRDARGNGVLSATDLVQAGRYAAGLDPLLPASGPTSSAAFAEQQTGAGLVRKVSAAYSPRLVPLASTVRVGNVSGAPGSTISVPIELLAQGNEAGLSFSLSFTPSVLNFVQATLGNGVPAGASFTLNSLQAAQGRLGVVLALQAGQSFPAGTRQLLVVNFTLAANATGTSEIAFGNQPVAREISDVNGNEIMATFTPGTVTIGGAQNPVPTLASLNPSSATAGGAAFSLTVNGTNFVSGATVRWNGQNRTTTFVSATQLTAQITAADIANAGTASVTVFNPAPGGGASNAASFTINPASTGTTIALTPGAAQTGTIPAPPQGQFVFNTAQYTLQVPANATQLKIDLSGDQDVDLFVRFGNPVAIQNNRLVADQQSEGATGIEQISVTALNLPALRPGIYYIAVSNLGPGAANFTLTATLATAADEVEREPNEALNTANPLPLAGQRTGNVADNDRAEISHTYPDGTRDPIEDLYRFELTRDTLVDLLLTTPSTTADLDLFLFREENGQLTLVDFSVADLSAAGISFERLSAGLKAGRYVAGVSAFKGAAGYTLTARLIDTITISAASYERAWGLAPESIVSIFSAGNLATSQASASSLPLPTTLAGTSVIVRDSAGVERLAPLFFVAPNQINLLIPAGTAPGLAIVRVNNANGQNYTDVLNITNAAPGLFTANASGEGVPAGIIVRVRGDGSQSFETFVRFDQATNRFLPAPIDLGPSTDTLVLVLFGTGMRGRTTLERVKALIGGVDAPVNYAAAQGDLVGLDQLNIILPRSLAARGEVELQLVVDGRAANPVKLNFK